MGNQKIKLEAEIDKDDALDEIDVYDAIQHYDTLDIIEAFSELYGDETYLKECSLSSLLKALAEKVEKYEAAMKEKNV